MDGPHQTRRGVVASVVTLSVGGCVGLLETPASDRPDYEIPIQMRNEDEQSHSVEITITGDRSEPHVELTRDLAPGSRAEVQPFTDLEDTGREEFQVHVSVDGGEQRVHTAEMNECFGAVTIRIVSRSQVYLGNTIC